MLGVIPFLVHSPPRMSDQTELAELVTYLVRSTRLTAAEARRVVDEVLSFMNELPEDFIRRRHLALQSQGHSNTAIFARIAAELEQRRFRAVNYSERQIRRIIYG
jgi:polyhydroxyalkanoate synthesis regulator phasin